MPWTSTSPTQVYLLGFLLLFTRLAAAQQPPPWPESSQNYNSPMATALIVMIIVFFTVGFISVYLRHFIACLGFDSYGGFRRGGAGRAREPANRGLDPTILNTFPTFLYSDVKIHRVGKTTPLECAVCISEFADHEILRLLPKCNHVFHPHCVDPWLSTHVTCPVCRANLETHTNISSSNQTRPFEHLTSDDDESIHRPAQPVSDHDHVIIRVESAAAASPLSQEGNLVKSSNSPITQAEIMKGLSMSESGRIIRLPRSHSTGHSLVEESDRFTLRLPEEVRNKLVNDINFNTNAIVSPRIGYHRPTNMGCADIPFKPDRWRFSMSPPFISRPNSPKLESPTVRTPNNNNSSTPGRLLRSPKNLFRSLKSPNISPLHRVVSCSDIGERSSNRLWDNRTPQDLDLEDHHHSHKQSG